jgi:DNA polymerase-1
VIWDDSRYVAFDFETSGELPEYALQPWRVAQGKAWATSLVWARKLPGSLGIYGGLEPDVAMMRSMLEDAIANKYTLVGWNTVFDISWLLAYGLEDLVMRCRWLDGMLLWRHYAIEPEYEIVSHKKKSFGLKTAVAEVLPNHAGYEEDVDFHSTDPAERRKLHEYNVRDTVFTLRLAKHWWGKLEPAQQRAALLEAEALPLVAAANLRGMVVDTLAANELRQHLADTAAAQLAKLAPHGVTEKVIRSPLQLSRLLFDEWKLPVYKENTSKLTGKVTRSTDKEALHELSFKDPRAKELRLYREALNNRTKFAEAPLDSVAYNEDGRTYPSAIVFGTYSGRLTYASKQGKNKATRQTGFALHQEKRGAEFRGIIVPPPGYTLMEFDASGQEFRWMAIASGDETMLRLCAPGEDPHAYMGARVTQQLYEKLVSDLKAGVPQAKDARQLGKVANLSLQYRTSARKLRSVARVQYNLPMELPQAQQIHAVYQRAYVVVPKYWDRQIAQTKKLGYVETFAGRRVQVVGNWGGNFAWSMGSTSINYRIQGTGADQKYLALAVLKSYLTKIGAHFAWDLHDGIYLYVPDARVQEAAIEIKRRLDNLPYQKAWGFTPPITLPWDCKVGSSWGSLKEYHYG